MSTPTGQPARRRALRIGLLALAALAVGATAIWYTHFRYVPRPIPVGRGAYTEREYTRDALKLSRRSFVDAFDRFAVKDPKWHEAARRYVVETALRDSEQPNAPSLAKLVADGRALVAAGCTDPAVLSLYARALDYQGDAARAEPIARQALAGFQKSRYPKLTSWSVPLRFAALCEKLGGAKAKEAAHWRDLGARWTAAAAGEIRETDREPVVLLTGIADWWEHLSTEDWRTLYEELQKSPKAHPYVTACVGARWHMGAARNVPYPHSPTEILVDPEGTGEALQGGLQSVLHLAQARALLVGAWRRHPEYPQAPAAMIWLTGGRLRLGRTTARAWFDRAVAAQVDYDDAYENMLWALKTSKASPDEVYRFGRECLDTGRFDTHIPYWFLPAVHDAWVQLGEDDRYWRRPDVYRRLRDMVEGYVRTARIPYQRDYWRTLLPEVAWRGGRYDDARREFDALGSAARATGGEPWLSGLTFAELRGDVYAHTGPAREAVRAAEQARRRGRMAEARKAYEQAIPAERDDGARRYLQDQLAAAKLEEQFAGGGWVDLNPDASFTGWQQRGQWKVQPDGAAEATCTEVQPWLVCRADFGDRLELRGEVEFVAAPDPDLFDGAIEFGRRGTQQQSYYTLELIPNAQGAVLGYYQGKEEPVWRTVVVGSHPAFTIAFWDGATTTYVDGRQVHRRVRFHRGPGSPPSGIGIGIGCRAPGTIVRFQNLQIRRLTRRP